LQELQELSNSKITLINKAAAKIGYKFIHEGGTKDCQKCPLKKVCIDNLETGRIYEVVKIRRKEHPCLVHEDKVVIVEVIEAAIEAAIKTRIAIEGVIIRYRPVECDEKCSNRIICQPRGLERGDRVKIEKIKEKINCPRGLKLVKASLRPIIP